LGLPGPRLPDHGLAEPVLETGRSDPCVIVGDEGSVVERCAEVARAAVGRHLAWIPVGAQHAAGELVETEPFGAGQLDRGSARGRVGSRLLIPSLEKVAVTGAGIVG
jgi:hypothetical protein